MYIFIDKYLGGSRSALALIRILWRWVAEIVGAVRGGLQRGRQDGCWRCCRCDSLAGFLEVFCVKM